MGETSRRAALLVLGLGAAAVLGAQASAPQVTPATVQARDPLSLGFELQARSLQGMRARAATLLVQGGQGGPLATAVFAATTGDAIAVLVEIEGLSLLEIDTEDAIRRVEVYAYALTPEGGVQDFFTQTVRLDLATWGERIFSSGVKLVGHLELPPGQYSLRVLAFDVATERFGLRSQPLVVPDPDQPQSRFLAALVAEPPGAWLLVREEPEEPEAPTAPAAGEDEQEPDDPRRERSRRRQRQDTAPEPVAPAPAVAPPVTPEQAVRPLVAGGAETALPAAWPVLEAGRETQLDLLVYGMPESSRITARLEPESPGGDPPPAGAIAAEAELEPLARTGLGGELERWAYRLRIPPELATAAYRLIFEADNGATYSLPVLMLAQNPGNRPMVWGQIRSTYASPEQTAAFRAPELPEKARQRNRALERASREGFHVALKTLTDRDLDAAVESLAAFEGDLLERAPSEALNALARAKRDVASHLAAKNPESLVPLVSLQMRLYHHYRDQKRFGLATQARSSAVELAELYAKEGDPESAPVVTSRALSILGADLLDARVWTLGEHLLEKALELDPANETALLLLASQQEKVGSYGEAVETLRALVRRNPKSAEGRLRLAVNLKRSGNPGEGITLLQRLVSENNPPWTLMVAYSELAGHYLETGRTGEAARVLRQALDRLPSQPGLAIQLAFALDRQRRFRQARQVLDGLTSRETDPGASPRHRYTAWPQKGLEEARRLLADGTEARTPLLGMVLEGTGSDEGSGEKPTRKRRG